MKKLVIPFILLFVMACGNNDGEKDSVEMAKEENDIKDNTKTTNPEELSAEHNFMVDAASGGMMEVQLGQYAAANAASAAVKQFGQMMVTEHSKADSMLSLIAQLKNIAIPNEPGEKHQQHIDELKKKKGADFDKDYMKLMVEDHEADIKKFEEISKDAKDEDIRNFAASSLPTLRKHLEQAKKIKDGLK